MRTFLIILSCVISNHLVYASPKAFDLKMDLSIDGGPVSSPQLIVKAGQKGLIEQGDKNQTTFIEVVASEDHLIEGQSTIFMKFVIGKIEKDGSRKVISRPQIRTAPNEKAQVTVGDINNPNQMSFSVIAEKTEL